MAPDDPIPPPPDNPDADLARRLAEGHHPTAADPFEKALVGFRARALRTSPPPGFANRLWGQYRAKGPLVAPRASPVIKVIEDIERVTPYRFLYRDTLISVPL